MIFEVKLGIFRFLNQVGPEKNIKITFKLSWHASYETKMKFSRLSKLAPNEKNPQINNFYSEIE